MKRVSQTNYLQFSLFLLLQFSLLFGNLHAQVADTVFVYDTIYSYDTVKVEIEERVDITYEMLRSLCEDDNAIFIQTEKNITQDATLLPVRVIKESNHLTDSTMKKKLWLIFPALFSIQSVFSHDGLSMYAGSSVNWLRHNTYTINNPGRIGGHFGFDYQVPTQRNFSYSIGAEFHYFDAPLSYRQDKVIDTNLPYFEYDYTKIYTETILNELNHAVFTKPNYLFAIPLKMKYQFGFVQPYIGAEYSYSKYLYQKTSESSTGNRTYFHNMAFLVGFDLILSKHLALKLSYSSSLFGEFNEFGFITVPSLGNKEYYFKPHRVGLSICYNFKLMLIILFMKNILSF